MLKFLLFFFLTISINVVFSQKSKQIKKYNITSITESKTDTTNNTTFTSKVKFDKNGNKIEEEIYSKSGKFKGKYQRKFNKDNELIEEIILDEKGNITEIIQTKFNLDLPVLITTVDKDNKTKETIELIYNGFGEKTQEIRKDKEGIVLEKSSYEYDNKGLKTKKTTFDKNNKIIETKTYIYTFE